MNLIKYLTPLNLAEEKEKFFSSRTYNPQLQYSWSEPATVAWANHQTQLNPLIQALQTQDAGKIKQAASTLFDTQLTPELMDRAQKIIAHQPAKLPGIPLAKVVAAFTHALDELQLSEYSVEVVDAHGFNFRPSGIDKKITVSQHLNLDFFSIDGEVKHELVHLIRYENGVFNNMATAADYLPTEEGLATYCQDYAGENGQSSLFQHAAEYAMTVVALSGALRDVTNYLESLGFSRELAWQRAIRHKFGFCDTSQPGDIMKPSMYFYHQQKIKRLSTDEKYRLFVGKITLDQLANYPNYTGRIPLAQLQQFYVWREGE